ncbi:phospholipase D-like domain-containing protein [Neisseria sp. Ec49-e6-T10]|uniref:phospholipase D-like domain-containing protein n=1 Tax=Neisseria sp. Ec49-e6-T10 TaxID=3140744 RepID=UPI003EBB73B3
MVTNPVPVSDEYLDLAEQIFARSSGSSISEYNQVNCLFDSEENFPAWQETLENATESIFIEMYIFSNDSFGTQIRDLLIQKALNGVHVILIYDWIGSLKQHYIGFFKPLRAAGATVRAYNKLSISSGFDLLSRDHRKLIIVDRKVAFVSGLCISSQWNGNPKKNIPPWRDTGVIMSGPIISQALAAFEGTLIRENLSLPERFKHYNDSHLNGHVAARLVATEPSSANMMRLDLLIISLARETLWLTDAYFMATGIYLNLIKNTALDGVDVRLLVPKTSDIPWIGAVSRTQYRTLLKAGVRIFEWNGPMIHAKSCVADGRWARIGSTNLNISSWFANREIDITIEDTKIAEQLQTKFLEDLENATEIILNTQEQAQLKQARPRQHNPARAKASAAARQAVRLGGFLRGDSRTIGKRENMALMGLGSFAVVLAILFFFMPKLIAFPLALLFMVSGLAFVFNAIYQIKKDIKRNKN